MKERLDKVIKERRLIRSRSRAQRLIMAGRIRVNGQTVYRPGHMVGSEALIELVSGEPYVSRGGEKLDGALTDFRLDLQGAICLDVGASTGGFTDCLLQHGAQRVHCVDVGKGQLDWRLRNHSRVIVHEGINARYLTRDDIGEQVELVTIDVSFISLRLVLPPLSGIVTPQGELIVLVKPQFEAGKEKVGKGGVVRDYETHLEVLRSLQAFIEEKTAWTVVAASHSPLCGPAGNIEFFFYLCPPTRSGRARQVKLDLAEVVEQAHTRLIKNKGARQSHT